MIFDQDFLSDAYNLEAKATAWLNITFKKY